MLEKIINITPGSDFKNSSRPNKYSKTSQYMHAFQSSIGDSVSLSPATNFLSTIHWRLKKLVNHKDKIAITFEFDSIEFTAHINQYDLLSINSFEYDVKKVIDIFSARNEFIAHVNSQYTNENKNEILTKLPALSEFIAGIVDMNSFLSSVSADRPEVQKLLFRFEDDLKSEFNYLDYCLISFFQKYLSIKINSQSLVNGSDLPLFQKIQVMKQ